MAGSKNTTDTTQNTNQSSTANINNTNTQTSGAAPFGEAALPGYEGAFNAAQGATTTLNGMPTVANTGNNNYVPAFAASQGASLQAPVQQLVGSGMNFLNQQVGAGYDLNNPLLQSMITSQRDQNDMRLQRALEVTRDQLSASGAYGGSGAQQQLGNMVSDDNTNWMAQQNNIYNDWMTRQGNLIGAAPGVAAQFAGLSAIPDQLQQPAFDANQANAQGVLDLQRQQAGNPIDLFNNYAPYFAGLSSAPVSQTSNQTGTSSTTGTGNSTTNTTQTSAPGLLQTALGLGSLATGIGGVMGMGGPLVSKMASLPGAIGIPKTPNYNPFSDVAAQVQSSQLDPFRIAAGVR